MQNLHIIEVRPLPTNLRWFCWNLEESQDYEKRMRSSGAALLSLLLLADTAYGRLTEDQRLEVHENLYDKDH